MHRGLCGVLLGLVGCESGTAAVVEIEVADAVARDYAEDAPGVLVGSVALGPQPLAPLCGDLFEEPLTWVEDYGFGCLDERKGTSQTLAAWIQPMPEGWDAAAFCALERSGYGALSIPVEVTGEPESASTADTAAPGWSFAEAPEEGWPQASTEGTWKRDGSPCGGTVKGELLLK